MIAVELIYNLSILVAISVISGFIDNRWKRTALSGAVLQGLLFGGAAIIGMCRPFMLAPGLFFDGRSVMLSLCGLFFGPISAAIASVMTIALRIHQGGMGARMGVLVILSSAIIGCWFRSRRKGGTADMPVWQLYLFGIVVHLAMLAMTLALPSGQTLKTLHRIALPCLGLYPLATILIGKILTDQQAGALLVDHLRRSEEKLRTLIDNIPGAVYRSTISPPWFAVHMSNNVESITGIPAEDFLNRRVSLADLVVPDDLPVLTQAGVEVIASRQPYEIEYRLKHRDGGIRWVQDKGQAVYSATGEPEFLDGVVLDITAHKKAEEERLLLEANLRHVQKMEAIGTLATGIAHDFNNLLTAISGYTDLAKAELPAEHPARQALDVVSTVVGDAGGIANALLTFSRKTVTGRAPVNLIKVVADSVKLLRRILPAGVELRDSLPAGAPVNVLADVGQLHQVLMNLITNAKDAMPDGGVISVELSLDESPTGEKEAVLVVSDTGVGMLPEVAARIFDPFFTTKPRGKGTGLGLAIVHGIIVEHDGRIETQSEPGKGTRITLRLPACEAAAPVAAETQVGFAKASRADLKVLLAEDEDFVRNIMTDTLRSAGYTVDGFPNGADALSRFSAGPDGYCLAILDIELPRMGGLRCYEEIRRGNADIPVILMTGNPEFNVEGREDDRLILLRKPFKMTELGYLSKSMISRWLDVRGR